LLSGCASIGKGAAEAVLEKSENEDTRQCQVWGNGVRFLIIGTPSKQVVV